MSPTTTVKAVWHLASAGLLDAYTDFILSRQAMNCTPATLAFYKYTAGAFLSWVESQGATDPQEIGARHVRQYLAQLAALGRSDTTMHDHARAIRTLLRFWHFEGYLPALIHFDMPKVAKKRLAVLTAEQLKQAVKACYTRDRAILLLMADSGLRRAEVIALNWGDVNMSNGLVRVRQGKGRKDRSAVVGARTRRALLAYRRTVHDHADTDPLFQSKTHARLTGGGLLLIFRRISKLTGIHVTPHAMRRTFVILSLRAHMDLLHLQALLGHAGLEMVQHYAQMVDDDLLREHKAHSPVDTFL